MIDNRSYADSISSSGLSLNNLKIHKAKPVKNICIQEKILLFHHCAILPYQSKRTRKICHVITLQNRAKIRTKQQQQNGHTKRTELSLVYMQSQKIKHVITCHFFHFNQSNNTLMLSLVLFISFTRVSCNRYDARWSSKTKSQNTRNGGIINPLFVGLTYNTSEYFAHCSYTTQLAKYPRVLFVNPSNKVYLFDRFLILGQGQPASEHSGPKQVNLT